MTLDGSLSTDSDSSSGTNDDIVLVEWFEYFEQPSQISLGTSKFLDVPLHLGAHIITLKATDSVGQTDTDEVVKSIIDTIPPKTSVSVSPDTLWPPNHKMTDVNLSVIATDICDADRTIVLDSVISSEPDDAPGNGDGHTTNDIQDATLNTPDYMIKLRFERQGDCPGRVYTVTYKTTYHSGNAANSNAEIKVAHDLGM